MNEFSNERPGPDPEREGRLILPWADDERLQQYVGRGHDLVQRSPLGHQLECLRDNVRMTGMPETHPPGDWGYHSTTAYHRARETALRLLDTERVLPGAVHDLWVYCNATTVGLAGLPGGKGRIFAITPHTELGREARRPAGKPGRLIGPRECDCSGRDCSCWSRPVLMRRLYAEFVGAKGEARQAWIAVYRQAEVRIRAASAAWCSTRNLEDERRLQAQERRLAAPKAHRVTVASSDA
jgi:hypothetical protein